MTGCLEAVQSYDGSAKWDIWPRLLALMCVSPVVVSPHFGHSAIGWHLQHPLCHVTTIFVFARKDSKQSICLMTTTHKKIRFGDLLDDSRDWRSKSWAQWPSYVKDYLCEQSSHWKRTKEAVFRINYGLHHFSKGFCRKTGLLRMF